MISVDKCGSMTVEQLQQQIDERRILIKQMVGTLYPSILVDEIEQLRQMIDNAACSTKHQKTASEKYDDAMTII